jgi:hypothetical protein
MTKNNETVYGVQGCRVSQRLYRPSRRELRSCLPARSGKDKRPDFNEGEDFYVVLLHLYSAPAEVLSLEQLRNQCPKKSRMIYIRR